MRAFLQMCFISDTSKMQIPLWQRGLINSGRYMVVAGVLMVILSIMLSIIYLII